MQQRLGRARNEGQAVHVACAELDECHALTDDGGLVGPQFVLVRLNDHCALGVGQITRDQLLKVLACVLRQRGADASDLLRRLGVAHRAAPFLTAIVQ